MDEGELVVGSELYEAVELSKAVFSEGKEVFEEDYDGDIEAYMLVQDVRNRVEVATMDSGKMVYPENLPDIDELGGIEDADIFYSLGSQDYEKSDLPERFFAEGLVEEENGDLFYGENAFPYLLLLDEAENIVEPESFEADVVETGDSRDSGEKDYFEAEVLEEDGSEDYSEEDAEVEKSGSDEKIEEEVSGRVSREDKVSELSEIWDDVAGSDD